MLAQNFKSPTDLRISETHHTGLTKVLGMLEREEIPEKLFSMGTVGDPGCGTPGCILGWVRLVTKEDVDPDTDGLVRLYFPGDDDCFSAYDATRQQAASALRNYLSHGLPEWVEVMGEP